MTVTPEDRTKILQTIKALVLEKHVNVANLNQDYGAWADLVDSETPRLAVNGDTAEFEHGVRSLLTALGGSHTAFFRNDGSNVPAPHAIHATLKSVETPHGQHWMFWDVIEEGVADRSGIKRGELLLGVDEVELVQPRTARFQLGATHVLRLGRYDGGPERTVSVSIPNALAKDRPPMIEPKSISHRMLEPHIGYVRVASFPGAIGQVFARNLDAAIADLKKQGCDRLIIDLRGNIGGGIGSLRLMSYLCPDKVPVGYSVTRAKLRNGFRKEDLPVINSIPTGKLGLLAMAFRFRVLNKDRSVAMVTEGLGAQPFHGRIAILQNEFTHSAAEMVSAFASENVLASIVGTRSAGEVLGGANFALPNNYRLRLPVAGWFSWTGTAPEGAGVSPNTEVVMSASAIAAGDSSSLASALALLHSP